MPNGTDFSRSATRCISTEMDKKIRLTAVVGPTASGKSALALALAKRGKAHIVSCDSMQIYRGMDVGTAKPTSAEMREVPHHMIDIADPGEKFTLADFVSRAAKEIGEITASGVPVILCGGTGLYIDTLLRGGGLSPDIPASAFEGLAQMSSEELFSELERVDPVSASAIHPNNRRRVERAVAVFRGTGITKSEWDARSRAAESPYDSCIIGLDFRDRALLYSGIDRRVDMMFEAGLEDEVRRIMPSRDSTAGQAIGYKEMLDCFDGLCTLDEARERIKQATRNYAKRQLTWFRANPAIRWIFVDEEDSPDAVTEKAEGIVDAHFGDFE